MAGCHPILQQRGMRRMGVYYRRVSEKNSIVLCLPDSMAFFDPDPEQTEQRGVQLVSEWDDNVLGVVGWSGGGWHALAMAAEHQEVPRLVVLATPFPDGGDEMELTVDLSNVTAKTLLLFGSADPLTGHRHGSRWQKHLPNARLEMVPSAGHDLLTEKWGRVLSHLAPRRSAKTG